MSTTPTPCPLTNHEVSTAAKHLLIAAIWADAPEGTHPWASAHMHAVAEGMVRRFAALLPPCLWARVKETDYGSHPDAGSAAAALGHDLYLTSRGHGVGFADREELPEDIRDTLESLVGWRKPFPEIQVDFYRGWVDISL